MLQQQTFNIWLCVYSYYGFTIMIPYANINPVECLLKYDSCKHNRQEWNRWICVYSLCKRKLMSLLASEQIAVCHLMVNSTFSLISVT